MLSFERESVGFFLLKTPPLPTELSLPVGTADAPPAQFRHGRRGRDLMKFCSLIFLPMENGPEEGKNRLRVGVYVNVLPKWRPATA